MAQNKSNGELHGNVNPHVHTHAGEKNKTSTVAVQDGDRLKTERWRTIRD